MKAKILFFGKLPPPYIGPAVATELIINSELADRFDLELFDISHHKSIDDLGKFKMSNITSAFKQYVQLFIRLITFKPDIVYMPSQQTTIAYVRDIPFILLTKLFRKKMVCQLRGGYFRNWYEESNRVVKVIVSLTQKLIDAQIVLGDSLKHMYRDFMPEERIFVVPNAADYPLQEIDGSDSYSIKVLFLGNFIKTKGIEDVLDSYFFLSDKHREKVEYLFAGNWRDAEVKEKFDEILADHKDAPIKVLGPIFGEEKFKLLSSCDILVFPSYYRNEGHPWVIVEAIASGLAIISTDHAAIPQNVKHELNGFLVRKHDPEEIAEKVMKLVDDAALLAKMKANSRKLYEEKFTEKNLVDNFTKVFNSVLKLK